MRKKSRCNQNHLHWNTAFGSTPTQSGNPQHRCRAAISCSIHVRVAHRECTLSASLATHIPVFRWHHPWPALQCFRVRLAMATEPCSLSATLFSTALHAHEPLAIPFKVPAIWGPQEFPPTESHIRVLGLIDATTPSRQTTSVGGSRRLLPALIVGHRLHLGCPCAGLSTTLAQQGLFSFLVRNSLLLGTRLKKGIS